jgi:hypothetical protein
VTGKTPRRPLPKDVRNTLPFWGGLLLLMVLAVVFDRLTRGDTIPQVVGNLPWGWILPSAAAFLAVYQITTRPLPLEPELERALRDELDAMARREHSCGQCGRPRQHLRVLCPACRKVVDWPGLLSGVFLALAILLVVAGRLRP